MTHVNGAAGARARPAASGGHPPAAPFRPLLKWAGGKRQLLPVFRTFYPPDVTSYCEPFAGSAAVFFDLWSAGRLAGAAVRLSDSNPDLIGCYRAVRDVPDLVIAALERLAAGHARGGAAHYYDQRTRFNQTRASLRERGDPAAYSAEMAGRFIYLNRTGYNGLYRLNATGEYNVPAGRYAKPRITDPDGLRRVSAALAGPGVRLDVCSYDETVRDLRPGDVVYFDPPYVPVSATSSFGAYTATRFSAGDQQHLCDTVVTLARAGVRVMLSNSSAQEVMSLYRQAVSAGGAGLSLWILPSRRAINARAERRGHIPEVLLTNLDPQTPSGRLSRLA